MGVLWWRNQGSVSICLSSPQRHNDRREHFGTAEKLYPVILDLPSDTFALCFGFDIRVQNRFSCFINSVPRSSRIPDRWSVRTTGYFSAITLPTTFCFRCGYKQILLRKTRHGYMNEKDREKRKRKKIQDEKHPIYFPRKRTRSHSSEITDGAVSVRGGRLASLPGKNSFGALTASQRGACITRASRRHNRR